MSYSAKEVAQLLGLTPARVRALAKAGGLDASAFSFQDLVLLRTAKGLLDAEVAPARVRRALQKLRGSLPEGRPLTALAISAEGHRVVVRDGRTRFDPESGQSLFDFDVRELEHRVAPLAERAARRAREAAVDRGADEWFDLGCELEVGAPEEARDAYARAVALDPDHADAHVNLGRILHEAGDLDGAEAHYRAALAARAGDSIAAFNLGLVLAARDRIDDAIAAFKDAIAADPQCADAHYNMAQLYERLGQDHAALRHLRLYKKLTDGR